MTDSPHDPHACAVCGQILSRHLGTFGQDTWIHSQPEDQDHLVVAVPAGEIRAITRCDFCLQEGARWVLPVETYTPVPGHISTGDWSACDTCASHLARNDWDSLTGRALEATLLRHPRSAMDRTAFQAIYAQLRDHITGPVRVAGPTPGT